MRMFWGKREVNDRQTEGKPEVKGVTLAEFEANLRQMVTINLTLEAFSKKFTKLEEEIEVQNQLIKSLRGLVNAKLKSIPEEGSKEKDLSSSVPKYL